MAWVPPPHKPAQHGITSEPRLEVGVHVRSSGRATLVSSPFVLFPLVVPTCSALECPHLTVITVPAALVREALATEVAQQGLPATAAALCVADHLQMLALVALLAITVGLPRPRQVISAHV